MNNNNPIWPQIVAADARLHNAGRTYRRHSTHTIPDFPLTKSKLQGLTAPNLNLIILSFDIHVSDTVWDTKGKIVKITAILRWFKTWQRRSQTQSQSNTQLRPPQILNNTEMNNFLSGLLHQSDDANDNNDENTNNNSFDLDIDQMAAFQMMNHEENDVIRMRNNNSNDNIALNGHDGIDNDNSNDIEQDEHDDIEQGQHDNIEQDHHNNDIQMDNDSIDNSNDDIALNGHDGIDNDNIALNGHDGNDIEQDGHDDIEQGGHDNIEQDHHNNDIQMDNHDDDGINENQNELPIGDNGQLEIQNSNDNNNNNNEESLENEVSEEKLATDDDEIMNDMNDNMQEIANGNPQNISTEYMQIRNILERHQLLHIFAGVQTQGIRNVNHLSRLTGNEFALIGISTLGDTCAMRAVLDDIKNNNIPLQLRQNIIQPPVVIEERYPEPTPQQVMKLHKKGVGSLFVILPSTHRLPTTSGEARHHFSNNTNNKTFKPIKHYILPTEPLGSKKYKYSIHSVNKINIYGAVQVGLITVSNIVDPNNNPAATGGYWNCSLSHPLLIPCYNDRTAFDREVQFKYMKKYRDEVDWWLLGGHRQEQVTLRSILDFDNPPDFNIPIETNAPRIDLRTQPRPFM